MVELRNVHKKILVIAQSLHDNRFVLARCTLLAVSGSLAGCLSASGGDDYPALGDAGRGDVDAAVPGLDGATRCPTPTAEPTPKPESIPNIDMNSLLNDDQVNGGAGITAAQVQDFLTANGSILGDFFETESQLSAAELIVNRGAEFGISPLYLLARIETESGLITSGTDEFLDAATGCGCPDSVGCNPDFGGFGNQIECAASKIRGYYNDLEACGTTISGWQANVARETQDGCWVTPANNATAALYTYTPWVGKHVAECGTEMWGGSSLVALLYYRFWLETDWDLDT